MIAKLQRTVAIALVVLAAVLAAFFAQAGRPGWAAASVVAVALAHSAILAIEFVLLATVTWKLPAQRPQLHRLLSAWAGEALQALRVFGWRQPFRAHVHPDFLPDEPTGEAGVLLVHGLLCNRGFWNPWLASLRQTSTAVIAVSLEPIHGSIDDNVRTIESAVSRLIAATGRAPVLVGHSRGGLVLRAWLATHGTPDQIGHVITIGTPHGGTWMARLAMTKGAEEMQLGSVWLAELRRRESPAAMARFTCFYSRCDNIVFPADCATLPGADNREVPTRAHVQMAFDPLVFDEVRRRLRSDDAPRPPGLASTGSRTAPEGAARVSGQ